MATTASLVDEILAAFTRVTAPGSQATHAWVRPYDAGKKSAEHGHQFLFFLKPEATAVHDGVKLPEVLRAVLPALVDAGIEFGAVRILTGDYLEKYGLMSEHYGVISAISRNGVSAISDAARAKLSELFGPALEAGAEVLGGHQFLAREPRFNPFSLVVLNDNLGTKRLAGGTYAMQIKVLGKPYILLNPFHAYQLVPYTTSGHAIIAIEGLSRLSWADLRGNVAGVTDPKKAADSSIRKLLLNRKEEFGIKEVDQGSNGVHMSAGPLEGMVELQRFFTDHEAGHVVTFDHTAFGALLGEKGADLERTKALAANPDFESEGRRVSAFDLTEEKNATDAADLLIQGKQAAAL